MTDEQYAEITKRLNEIDRGGALRFALLALLIAFFSGNIKCAPITSNPTSIEYNDCGGWAPSQLKYEPGQITWWAADCSQGWHTAELRWSYTIWGGEMATHLPVSATFAADHSLGRLYLIDLAYPDSILVNGERYEASLSIMGPWRMATNLADVFIPVDLLIRKTDIPEPSGAIPMALILAWFFVGSVGFMQLGLELIRRLIGICEKR